MCWLFIFKDTEPSPLRVTVSVNVTPEGRLGQIMERNTLAPNGQIRFFNDQMAGRLSLGPRNLNHGGAHAEHQGFDIRPASVDARARLSAKATRAARSTLSISDPERRRGEERAEQYKRAERRNLFGES